MGIIWSGTATLFETTARIMKAEGVKEYVESNAKDWLYNRALEKFTGPFKVYRAKNELERTLKVDLKTQGLRERVDASLDVFEEIAAKIVENCKTLSGGYSPCIIAVPRFMVDSIVALSVKEYLEKSADFNRAFSISILKDYYLQKIYKAINKQIDDAKPGSGRPAKFGDDVFLIGIEEAEEWPGEQAGTYMFLYAASFDLGILKNRAEIDAKMKNARSKRAGFNAEELAEQQKFYRELTNHYIQIRDWHPIVMENMRTMKLKYHSN